MTVGFGQLVTVAGNQVRAIFDNAYQSVDVGGSTEADARQPQLLVRTSAIPSVARGDVVVVAGVTYGVIGIEPDGTGVTLLLLERAS